MLDIIGEELRVGNVVAVASYDCSWGEPYLELGTITEIDAERCTVQIKDSEYTEYAAPSQLLKLMSTGL